MRRSITALIAALILVATVAVPAFASGGFDQYGYNRPAGIFNGTYLSLCESPNSAGVGGGTEAACLAFYGIYANDQLIMKWNPAWDACNAHGYNDLAYCAGAWLTNEENGQVTGGSGAVWHYKFIWVGSAGSASSYWAPGGYSIWGNYEVIMDQGIDPNWTPGHYLLHATPNGLR